MRLLSIVLSTGPGSFRINRLKAELVRYTQIIKDANIKPE